MIKKVLLFISIVVFLAFGSSVPVRAQTPKTVKLMTRALRDSILLYEIANRLGFYREEGLRVETPLAPLSTGVQAVLGGSADYVNHGSVIGAILAGVPFRVLAVDADKPPHYIVAKPEFMSLKDLIGKTIAIDDIAGASYMMVRTTLIKNEVPLDKVIFRALGPPPRRFQALLTGLVDAAPLSYIESGLLKQKGFRIVAYTGDFTTDVQMIAAAPIQKIQRSPEEIYKFLKATLKARIFQFENSDEAYKFFLEVNDLGDDKFARDGWRALADRSSSEITRAGMLSREMMVESINQWKEQMKLARTPLKVEGQPEDVYDFSFAKRANEELKAEGWDARKYRYIGK